MKRGPSLPITALAAWAKLNDVCLDGIEVRSLPPTTTTTTTKADGGGGGLHEKGAGLFATRDRQPAQARPAGDDGPEVLVRVPADLVLALTTVETHAKSDRYLREVLDATGDFGKTARGAILLFLLLLLTHASQDCPGEAKSHVGLSNPWTGYLQFLPEVYPLPTFYSDGELEILRATSLQAALEAKLGSLEREFEQLRQWTGDIPWCRANWWDGESGKLTFHDWKVVDAMYRSRALDLPEYGHAMVPCLDMANHASGAETRALYEMDEERNIVLQVRYGQSLRAGDEVTITLQEMEQRQTNEINALRYGDEKGAAEMIFSYGFLEGTVTNARQLFLELQIPDDDPLKPAKMMACNDPPGVRVFTRMDPHDRPKMDWESAFVWWVCVNEEDGLGFEVLQSNDGGREVQAAWKGSALRSSAQLRAQLEEDPLWDVYRLRAVVTIQERLLDQQRQLADSHDAVAEWAERVDEVTIRQSVWDTTMRLRGLEEQFLGQAIDDLETEKHELAQLATVQQYLGRYVIGADVTEDFS
ncbi:hypothetical protein LOZ58_000653 [Ophidiomyces ophidiicola]|nr:hypothetical protein LOZ58_000653 [Ophidiomyces ophidiicola]